MSNKNILLCKIILEFLEELNVEFAIWSNNSTSKHETKRIKNRDAGVCLLTFLKTQFTITKRLNNPNVHQ